jgi:uncharacterized protein YyaL (SSP411 family)
MGSVGQESVEPRVTQQPKAAVSGIPLTRRNARNLALTGASALWPRNAQLLLRNARATLGTEPWRDFLKGDRGPARLDALADAALGWIRRSQDRVGSGGVGDRTFHGWTPGYPEVTGYIIPTFWDYHELRGSDDLAQRALRMAEWELRLQKSEGGFESLYEGEGQPAVVFNTGQVIRGLTRTYLETREDRFLDAAMRAADWIVANQEPDGSWTKANYLGMKRTYDVYAAAGLAELATVASEDRYASAALANCEFALRNQRDNGWFDRCDNRPQGNATPSTHTLCYTVDGLLETGTALGEDELVAAAERSAAALLEAVDASGRLPGRFDDAWRPASSYVVVTGTAQLGVILMKLFLRTRSTRQLDTALRLLDFLAYVQKLDSVDADRDGGLPGSFPIWGRYVPLKHPSWATKFYLDHLRLVRAWVDEVHSPAENAGASLQDGVAPGAR